MQLLKYAEWRFGSDDSARGTAPSMYVDIIGDLQFCRRLKVALVVTFEDSAYIFLALVISFRSRSGRDLHSLRKCLSGWPNSLHK